LIQINCTRNSGYSIPQALKTKVMANAIDSITAKTVPISETTLSTVG